ncbi:MAG: DNA polymerase ligase N-terminal domain-containing protein [Candidatus Bathyarchaeota archaeon]|jgi:DNA ligase D-like protein (predicted 3'-phosphoesterase)
MSLKKYQKKRDFKRTTEPEGRVQSADDHLYVVQKHDASHLHYDLRLELDGVLKSWTIPKTPPTVVGVKRLAVQTEDHPIEYANFEGVIPKGEYGAGTVEIWDKGEFTMKNKEQNKLIFEIKGEKLKGDYCLIRFKGKNNWLFFKKKSQYKASIQ